MSVFVNFKNMKNIDFNILLIYANTENVTADNNLLFHVKS